MADRNRQCDLCTRVTRRDLAGNVALFSLDVETDYGTGRSDALGHVDRFADLMAEIGVPWTAFIEGQLFRTRRDLCRLLRDRGADLQLHCYDHHQPTDTPASLLGSADLYASFCGRPAEGYRAHTYRLTQRIVDTLVAAGFKWDSSLMRAYAQGGTRDPRFRRGDYLVFGDSLVEFPMGTWRGLPLPLNHPHLLLAKTPGELLLRTVFGPSRLLVYNLHMTDLVRCESLRAARRTTAVKLLHKYLWTWQGRDTFPVVRRFVAYLRRAGYEMLTTHDLYRRVTAELSALAPAETLAPGAGVLAPPVPDARHARPLGASAHA